MLIEYLYPLIMDDYLMDDQFLQFMYDVELISQDQLKHLMLNLLEMHFNPQQMTQFTKKFMKALTKKILNQQILVNKNGKPMKIKDIEMTYWYLLIDVMERDEFCYSWINSDTFESDLELLFEIHMPS